MNAFTDVLVRSSLVLGLGLLAAAALRRQPAALRHWVLAATIGFAAVQPVFTLFLPSWHLPSLSWNEKSRPATSAPSPADTDMSFEMVTPLPRPTEPASDWRRIAAGVWLVGSAGALAVIALAMGWLARLRRRASTAGTEWDAALASVQRRIGVHRHVDIVITRHPAMLVTWGALRPSILLPADADTWTMDRKELVVAHEMAHLVRHDWLIQVLAETARAIYWFNPLFWIACARLRQESECASDDIVLETGIAGTSYASHLVDLARTFSVHGHTWLPAPSIARPSTLERRVRAMLNPRMNRRPISAVARVALAAAVFSVSLPIAAAVQGAGSPSGTLRDPQGRVLPGATVRLSGIGIDAIHETQSDPSGAFQFPEIPDGDYMLSARLPGFLSARQRVRVSSANAPLDVTLQVGTLQETITVRSDGSSDEAVRATTSARSTPKVPVCGTTELGGNLKPPMKVKDVRPRYRQTWVANNIEGSILMQAIIGVDGKVRNLEVLSPVNADLEEEAIGAVSQWEFSPTYLNCQPIEVRMFVTTSFKIDR